MPSLLFEEGYNDQGEDFTVWQWIQWMGGLYFSDSVSNGRSLLFDNGYSDQWESFTIQIQWAMGGGYCLTRFTQYNYCLTRDTVTNGRILLFNTGFTNQWEEFTVWRGCNDWWEGFTVGIQTNGWGLLFEMEYRDRLEGKITNKKMYWVPQSCHLWGVLQKQNPCSRQSTYKHTWIKSVNTIMHNIHTCWTAQHTHLSGSTTYTPVRQHNMHTC